MPAHRQHSQPSLYLPVVGWVFQLLIGSVLGVIAGVVILLAILWVMALGGIAW